MPSEPLSPAADRRTPSTGAALALIVLVASIAYFAWRAVLRAFELSGDLKFGYATIQALFEGLNPYDPGHLERMLLAGGGTMDGVPGLFRNVYFPTTLPVFLPISLGTWPQAQVAGLALNVLLVVAIIVGLLRYLDWPLTAPRSLAFGAVVFALAPIHTTIADGQNGVAAVAPIVAAMLLGRRHRETLAGACYGLATAVKVQVGVLFLGYLILRRRWHAVAGSVAVLAVLTLVAVIPLTVSGQPWFDSWLDNLRWASGPDGINNAGPQNPDRISMINLQYPLRALGVNETLAEVITVVVVIALAAAYLWSARRSRRADELLDVSMISVLSLLVTYHRYYDAVLLVFPVALGFAAWREGRQGLAALVLLCCADFLLPFQTGLNAAAERGLVPGPIVDSVVWRVVLLAQHAWVLVVLAILLILAAFRGVTVARAGTSAMGPPGSGAIPTPYGGPTDG